MSKIDFPCGNRRCTIHWARGYNTSRVNNWTIVSTSNRKKHLSSGPVRLQFMSASWLLTHLHAWNPRRTWHIQTFAHGVFATLNTKHVICSILSWRSKPIIVLLDITNKLNSLTFHATIIQLALSSFLVRRSSLVLVVVLFSLDFSIAFSLSLSFPFGLVVTLPFLRWVCPFTNVSLQPVLWWIALCAHLSEPTLRFFVANSPTPSAVSSNTSLFTTLGLESESFVCILPLFLLFPPCFPPFLFLRAFSQLELWIQLDPFHHAKTPQLRPINLQFPGRHPQRLIQHQMLSHVLWCDFVRANCLSNSFTHAFTSSCRMILSRGLSRSEPFVHRKVLAMLDHRFRPPLISHKHTVHLCRVTLTMCRPDLQAPDLHWTTGIFGNPDSCYLQFLEAFVEWFTDCTHCNQERPFPAQETCLVPMV